jgi:hypothetical protein
LLVSLVLLTLLVSCGAKSYDANLGGAEHLPEDSVGKLPGNSMSAVLDENRKIIKNVSESVHTDKFDDFMSGLRLAVSEAGGYISSASYNGESYYNENALRSSNLVIRIPAENLDAFTNTVDSLGVVYSYSESVRDVTEAYVDVESRIGVLEAEEAALLSMLADAKTVNETITVRTRLSEVQADLASLEAQKDTYDSLIAYSTVNMYVREVRRAESLNPGFFEEVAGTFSDSLVDIGEFLRSFAIAFLGNIIYIVIISGIVAGAIILWIKVIRKRVTKKNKRDE